MIQESPPTSPVAGLQYEMGHDIHPLPDHAPQHVPPPDGVVERVGRGLAADGGAPVGVDLGHGHRQVAPGGLPDQGPQVGDDGVPLAAVGAQLVDRRRRLGLADREGVAVDGDDVHQVAVGQQKLAQPVAAGFVSSS